MMTFALFYVIKNDKPEIVSTINPIENIEPASSFHPVFKQIMVTSEKHTISQNIPEIEKMEDFDPSLFVVRCLSGLVS